MRTRLVPVLTMMLAAAVTASACGRRASGGTTAVSVTDIELGRSLRADLTIDDQTVNFRPSDVIYAVVETKGSGPATLATRWTFEDNQVIDQSSRTISPNGTARTEFHISRPDGWPKGKYRLTVLLNGTTAGTKDFEVE